MELTALFMQGLGAVAAAVIGVIAFLYTQRQSRQEARRSVGDLSNQLVQFRMTYPEVVPFARVWQRSHWDVVYGAEHSDDAVTAIRYYAYIDAGLEFCNSALAARRERWIATEEFDGHYRPLVELFIAENYPIISQMMDKPFLSEAVRGFISRHGKFQELHDSLVRPDAGTQPAEIQ